LKSRYWSSLACCCDHVTVKAPSTDTEKYCSVQEVTISHNPPCHRHCKGNSHEDGCSGMWHLVVWCTSQHPRNSHLHTHRHDNPQTHCTSKVHAVIQSNLSQIHTLSHFNEVHNITRSNSKISMSRRTGNFVSYSSLRMETVIVPETLELYNHATIPPRFHSTLLIFNINFINIFFCQAVSSQFSEQKCGLISHNAPRVARPATPTFDCNIIMCYEKRKLWTSALLFLPFCKLLVISSAFYSQIPISR
jgi:hypothetical protein